MRNTVAVCRQHPAYIIVAVTADTMVRANLLQIVEDRNWEENRKAQSERCVSLVKPEATRLRLGSSRLRLGRKVHHQARAQGHMPALNLQAFFMLAVLTSFVLSRGLEPLPSSRSPVPRGPPHPGPLLIYLSPFCSLRLQPVL